VIRKSDEFADVNPTATSSTSPSPDRHPRTYRLTTLGCRVNHAEMRDLESILVQRGLEPAPRHAPADLEVIHTCSVTRMAAAKSRQAIRRAARRRAPGAPAPEVMVTGCFVGTDPEVAADLASKPINALPHALPETTAGTEHDPNMTLAARFADRVDRWLRRQAADGHTHSIRRDAATGSSDSGIVPLPVIEPARNAGAHIRAEIRIQDGCDAHCTFCILPSIRPTLRSKPVDDVVREARMLVDRGHAELVLSGIFIGAYGHETALRRRQRRPGAEPLADLLDAVAQVDGVRRLRISSMEPGDVSEPLLDAMVANAPIVVPHVHLPLQSGSDAILRRMNRQYRTGEYLDMIDMVNAALTTPDGMPPAITTDIICGFPGETDEDFERTAAVAQRIGFLHMHVFPYSPRPGTAAARWTSRQVPASTSRERVRRLIAMETDPTDGLGARFRRRLVGRSTRMIVERPSPSRPGMMQGRCDHYAMMAVPTQASRGTLLDVSITALDDDTCVGVEHRFPVRLPVVT